MTTTLLRGGRVHSPADPFATALVVEDGVVVWIGSDSAAATQADGMDSVVDLDDAVVTPAFVDAHIHATSTGLALTGLDLTSTSSLGEALSMVEAAGRRLRGGVVLGHGWDETRWPEGRPPSRAELDRASFGGVVYLSRIDVHSAAVSSALVAAVPEVVAAEGYSSDGPLRTQAHHLVRRAALDSVTPAQRRAAHRATRARAASLGIALLHEMAGPDISSAEDLTELLVLARDEAGPAVVGYWGEPGGAERARELGALGAAGDLFADGAIGSRTAHLRVDYADAPGRGHAYLDAAGVRDHVVACVGAGVQAGFHAIGDAALDIVLAGFTEAADKVGVAAVRAGRHRLEHAEMLDAIMIATMSELGLYASVQPVFDALWGGPSGMYAARLGTERGTSLNPIASLVSAGVPVVFGSDAPVTPLGPWEAVRAAAFHRTPEQSVSVRAAFAAHSRAGWRVIGRDDVGVLVPGAPAHLAVWDTGELTVQTPDSRLAAWSTDPRAAVPGLPDLTPGVAAPTCLRTYVDGVAVHTVEGALT